MVILFDACIFGTSSLMPSHIWLEHLQNVEQWEKLYRFIQIFKSNLSNYKSNATKQAKIYHFTLLLVQQISHFGLVLTSEL